MKKVKVLLFLISLSVGIPSIAGIYTGNEPSIIQVYSGQITDADGQPLAGVAIKIPGQKQLVYTNFEGQFEIKASNQGKTYLKISYIGYGEKEVEVELNASKAETPLNITLKEVKLF